MILSRRGKMNADYKCIVMCNNFSEIISEIKHLSKKIISVILITKQNNSFYADERVFDCVCIYAYFGVYVRVYE